MRIQFACFVLTAALISCSNGDDEQPSGTGGGGGSTATHGTGGVVASGGNGGSSQTGGSGGSSQTGGSGGSGGGTGGKGASGSPDSGVGGSGGQPLADASTTGCGEPCDGPAGGYAVGCCGDRCVGLYNDPKNCGECGKVCSDSAPYCDNGRCAAPPCNGVSCQDAQTCCGSTCCDAGQLCCGVNVGPFVYECHTPTEAEPSCPLGCPSCLCASPDTLIATPNGERPIASLAVGDLVYSMDHGAMEVVPIARVRRTRALNHHVMRVVLVTGAVLEISAGHPTADGRTFADLSAGSTLGDVEVLRVEAKPYLHAFTYDILPDSDSGSYVAGGVLIGSTLAAEPLWSAP